MKKLPFPSTSIMHSQSMPILSVAIQKAHWHALNPMQEHATVLEAFCFRYRKLKTASYEQILHF